MTALMTKRLLAPALLMVLAVIGALTYLQDGRHGLRSSLHSLVMGDMGSEDERLLQDENATLAPTAADTVDATVIVTPEATPSPTVASTPSPTIASTPAPTVAATDAPTPAAITETPTVAVTIEEETPEPSETETPDEDSTPEPSPTPFFDDGPVPSPTRAPTTDSPSLAPFAFPEVTPAPKTEVISQAAIIGISAAAGGCLLLLAAFLLIYNRKKPKDTESVPSNGKSHCDTSYTNTSPQIFVPLHGGDEVSTLGDPAGLYGGASRKNMFDDDACSLNTNSMNRMLDSATHGVDPESLRDPGECFDVRLPAGKAGVVLEEGPGGNPVVHSVKPGSPLFHHVKQGDRLLSIEGVDCTGMSPHVIAKKLQANENASSRILTFSRSVL